MEIPAQSKRNEFGLKELPEGQEYKFTSDNRVDWKSIVPKEYLVINKSYENQIVEKLGKPLSEVSVDEVEDNQKIMLLDGTRFLLEMRGYSKLEYSRPVYGPEGSVAVECKITFIPNFETEGREIVYSGIGEATLNNASPIGKNKKGDWVFYLAATAENRAVIRCVRNFLRIKILGKDEFSVIETTVPEVQSTGNLSPLGLLEAEMKRKGWSFELLKRTAISLYQKRNKEKKPNDLDLFRDDPTNWESLKSVSANDSFTLINLIKKSK